MRYNVKVSVNAPLLFTTIILTIVFFVLQVTNVISWPWIWVFSPLWILAAIMILILAIMTLVFVVSESGSGGTYSLKSPKGGWGTPINYSTGLPYDWPEDLPEYESPERPKE
jgi:hypothetical protein